MNDKPVATNFATYRLDKGSHVLSIGNREDGAKIATVVLVRKGVDFVPARDLK
ncbi:MAG: hypothetical protein Q7U75_09080 [Desulfobacterales bacterium]|nr:hypothetical protein [Desulfobacterales bacterium]